MNLLSPIKNWLLRTLSPNISSWLRAEDVLSDTSNAAQLKTPYAQSSWVYTAISSLADGLSQVPFRISRGAVTNVPAPPRTYRGLSRNWCQRARDAVVDSGPVVDLFNNPHEYMDRDLFWQYVVTWDCLRGEFFIAPLDGENGVVRIDRLNPNIQKLLVLSPDLMWHMVQGYELKFWRYTGSPLLTPLSSQYFLREEIIHKKRPNPYLFWRGMSPLTVANLPAATDFAAGQFMKGLMMNNADTGIIAETDQWLSSEQREQVLAALRERKRMAGTADRPLILGGGLKVVKPTISSVDMQFLENRKLNRLEIGAIFKVPATMMGFTEDANRAIAEQERLTFVENSIAGLCARLEAAVQPVVKAFGADLEGWFDLDSLPIMQLARRDRVDTAAKVWAMGVAFNEINEIYDLGFEDSPDRATGYLPFSVQPVAMVNNPPEPAPAPAPASEDNPAAKILQLLSSPSQPSPLRGQPHLCAGNPGYEASIKGSERIKKSKLSRFFFDQRGRVLAKLDAELNRRGAEARNLENKALDDLFNVDEEGRKLFQVLAPLLRSDLEFGVAQLSDELGLGGFSLPPSRAIDFLNKRQPVIKDINQTTWDQLKGSLQEGLAAGESANDMIDRVRAVFQEAGDVRAEMIATTETNVAVNSGRFQGMQEAGIEFKGWRTAHLENTRVTHLANEALSDEEGGIPIDEEWPNGCMYPGDPDGDPGETINCRCFGYAVVKKKGEPARRPGSDKLLGFGEFVARKLEAPKP